jgi:hypothetical protein
VSSYDTINDCCDAERFEKPINATLDEVRALTGDGLFTAYPGEKVLPDCALRIVGVLTASLGLGRGASYAHACVWSNRYP